MGDGIERTAVESIIIYFQKYVVFAGRAPRPEYWWPILFSALIQIIIAVVSIMEKNTGNLLSIVFSLATFLPSISVGVRRLHDLDRSGWW